MSRFDDEIAGVFDDLVEDAGVLGALRRGGVILVSSLTLVRARSQLTSLDEQAVSVAYENVDFLTKSAWLKHGGNPIELAAGDELVVKGVVYRLARLGGERVFRFMDPGQRLVRIHTRVKK